eukprot:1190209-Prorocentrum_minimum.AAC.3
MDGFPRLLFETALAPLSVRKDNPSTTYVELISPPVVILRSDHLHRYHPDPNQSHTTRHSPYSTIYSPYVTIYTPKRQKTRAGGVSVDDITQMFRIPVQHLTRYRMRITLQYTFESGTPVRIFHTDSYKGILTRPDRHHLTFARFYRVNHAEVVRNVFNTIEQLRSNIIVSRKVCYSTRTSMPQSMAFGVECCGSALKILNSL